MRLAVLLLQNSDLPRATAYDRDFAQRIVNLSTGLLTEQSGGREIIEFRVFDWFTLPMTGAEWMAAGMGVGPIARGHFEAGTGQDIGAFDHFALVIDRADASLAAVSTTNPEYVYLAAQDLDPALLAHELGHFLGAGHANLDTPTGPSEYDDQFCVMGREGGKFSFVEPSLGLLDAAGATSFVHADSGPGMVAPTLLCVGWLDAGAHGIDLSADLADGFAQVRLPPLRGAPAPNQPERVFAFAGGVTAQTVTVEVRARDAYDRAMPDPGPGGVGWVAIHETQTLGRGASPLLLGSLPARPGATTYVPRAALGVAVTDVDPASGVVGLSVVVERAPSRYLSVWEPLDGVPFQARHGLDPAAYQQTFTELATQGFRLVDVDAHRGNGQTRFAGVWRLEPGPAWEARHGLTSEQYQHTFDDMTARGFRPLVVCGYEEGGGDRYAAVWTQSPGPAWVARHGLDAAGHQALFDTLPQQGFKPMRLSAYTVGGRDLFASIWHQEPGEWLARHGLSAQEYQALFDERAGLGGWRLADAGGYGSGGQDRYAAIWHRADGPGWEARHGLSPFQHQQQFDSALARGLRITRISGHNPSG